MQWAVTNSYIIRHIFIHSYTITADTIYVVKYMILLYFKSTSPIMHVMVLNLDYVSIDTKFHVTFYLQVYIYMHAFNYSY